MSNSNSHLNGKRMSNEIALHQMSSYINSVTLSKLHLNTRVRTTYYLFKIKVNSSIKSRYKKLICTFKYYNGAHHLRNNIFKGPLKQEIGSKNLNYYYFLKELEKYMR